MKIKQFRYMTSNIAGYFNDAVEGGIDFQGIRSEIKRKERDRRSWDYNEPIVLPDYYKIAETEIKQAYKIKKECEVFINNKNVKSITINNYTTHRHNNGGHDTIFECVTILYED